jgi:hypothetical protein
MINVRSEVHREQSRFTANVIRWASDVAAERGVT